MFWHFNEEKTVWQPHKQSVAFLLSSMAFDINGTVQKKTLQLVVHTSSSIAKLGQEAQYPHTIVSS